MSLHAQLKDIRDAIVAQISGYTGLPTVLGKKIKLHSLKFPMIWVYPELSSIDNQSLAIHEEWTLSFWILSLVKSTGDIDVARDLAEELAIKAGGALLLDPTFQFASHSLGDRVADIQRTNFAPSDDRIINADESLFGAGVQITMRLENEEVA